MNERINTNQAKEPNEDAHGLTKERRGILLFIFHMDSFRRIFQAWTSSCAWSCLVTVFLLIAWWLFGWQRLVVENVKELYHASLLTHDLFTWFYDFITTFRLTPTHNSRFIRKETHTQRPVVSTWNSAIYEAIKHVPHTCRLVMYR